MHFLTAAVAATASLGGLGLVAAAPFSVPSANGFPNPNPDQLKAIQNQADGTLSNAPPPAKISDKSIPIFQLVKINEDFESAYFYSVIQNITNKVPGFEVASKDKEDELLDILGTVLAQEELHSINAANTLKKFNAFVPGPCKYQFPTTNLRDAVRLADTFTDLVLGTLQDASQGLAINGDNGAVRGVASTIGQEGQQSGFYRSLLSKKPSEKPFLTTSVGPFALSALQQFIVPGSCPFQMSQIGLPIFPVLNVLSGDGGRTVEPKDQTLSFSADLSGSSVLSKIINGNGADLTVVYFSGQLVPIKTPLTNVRWSGNVITFDANFPFTENVMSGLTVASLAIDGVFVVPGDVVGQTLAAPGLIQADDFVKSWDGL
ncbi:hypothetical protein B0T26DRAFT_838784 [Lasiosphaeria miniovina]|uniref:Late sexual development protein n=1 Tax=Lasiosphaeria miniovina TaxID=1954250 RepID=A0AA39ZSX6_9PEZI|nr:uncharacterized protein B0T26DRAFT_838784 [Lasiosphaeria miniovina]KAK0702990.1 hypothetical protein B0T26DRAFT_838784 [Lasiosphaeria miniovina]